MAKPKAIATPYTLAVDIGYGYTQAMDTLGNRTIQPSVYAPLPINLQPEDLETEQRAYPGLTLYNPEGTLLMGEFARKQVAREDLLIRLQGRANDDFGKVFRLEMVKMAAAQLLADETDGDIVHAQVITGLPVDYLRDRDTLKSALIGQHKVITDTANFTLNVTNAVVMPQPMGTVYSYRLTSSGDLADFGYKTMIVFDFGTYTAQVVTHEQDGSGGGFVAARSFSVGAGAYLIRDRLNAWLEAEHGESGLSTAEIDAAIRTGSLKVSGVWYDVSAPIGEAVQQILETIQARAGATIGRALNADVVVVAGGIAPLMSKALADVYGKARTFLADDPQWANVRGYLFFAKFRAKQAEGA
jgi:plasmid segregation protein ParM